MTVIAWDGKQLVCDSQSTRMSRNGRALVKNKNNFKLILLDTPWLLGVNHLGEKRYITALAGGGPIDDIGNIVEIIKVFSDQQIPFSSFRDRIASTMIKNHTCNVVGAGYIQNTDGLKTPYSTMLFTPGNQTWGCTEGTISVIGDIDYAHPVPIKGEVFKSAVEYASYHCFFRDTCGGKLFAYNPVTDTLTSPKHISRKRVETIAKKLKAIEIKRINEKYDKLLTPTSC